MSPQSLEFWRKIFFERIYRRHTKGQRGLTVFDVLARRAIPGTGPDRASKREACIAKLLGWLRQEGFEYVRKSYRGSATPEGFLRLVVMSRLMDCDRNGKYVPKGVREKGPEWVEIFKLYYRQKKDMDQIVNAMACEPYRLSPEETREILYALWAAYPENPGFAGGNVSCAENDEGKVEDPRAVSSPTGRSGSDPALRREMQQIVEELSHLLGSTGRNPGDPPASPSEGLQAFREGLRLTPDERLVLRMVFADGLSVSEAARSLRMKRHRVDTIRRSALEKIRSALEKMGYHVTDLDDF